MFSAPEHVAELNKAGVDAALQFGQLSFAAAEKLVNLQVAAAKNAFVDFARTAKSVAEVKDAQQLATLGNHLSQVGIERATGYSRELYELATETQTELKRAVEQGYSELSKSWFNGADKTFKTAPVGSDAFVAPFKWALAASNAAVESFTKVAKQAADFTAEAAKPAAKNSARK